MTYDTQCQLWYNGVMNKIIRTSPIGMLGKKHTQAAKDKIRDAHIGELNNMWRGDKVGYSAVHAWVRRHGVKPELCECCHKVPPRDLANISGNYLRDVNDWEYLCRRCHMLKDGRMKNLRVGNVAGVNHPSWKHGLTGNREYKTQYQREYRKRLRDAKT